MVTLFVQTSKRIGYIFKKGIPKDKFYNHPALVKLRVETLEDRLQNLDSIVQKLKTIPESVKNEIIDDMKNFFQVDTKELTANYNLTWNQVREMSDDGISFGAHTVTHPILTKIPIERVEKEIRDSKKRIESEIGKPVTGFCYPNGTESDFNDSIIDILKKHNFRYAVTTTWGYDGLDSGPFKLRRMEPNFDGDLARFECLVSGGFEFARNLRDKLSR